MKTLSWILLIGALGLGTTALYARTACCTDFCKEKNCASSCTCKHNCQDEKNCETCCEE